MDRALLALPGGLERFGIQQLRWGIPNIVHFNEGDPVKVCLWIEENVRKLPVIYQSRMDICH